MMHQLVRLAVAFLNSSQLSRKAEEVMKISPDTPRPELPICGSRGRRCLSRAQCGCTSSVFGGAGSRNGALKCVDLKRQPVWVGSSAHELQHATYDIALSL